MATRLGWAFPVLLFIMPRGTGEDRGYKNTILRNYFIIETFQELCFCVRALFLSSVRCRSIRRGLSGDFIIPRLRLAFSEASPADRLPAGLKRLAFLDVIPRRPSLFLEAPLEWPWRCPASAGPAVLLTPPRLAKGRGYMPPSLMALF